jgi:hypothetical protein
LATNFFFERNSCICCKTLQIQEQKDGNGLAYEHKAILYVERANISLSLAAVAVEEFEGRMPPAAGALPFGITAERLLLLMLVAFMLDILEEF